MLVAVAWIGALPSLAVENERAAPIELRYEMSVGADGKATSLKSIGPLPDAIDEWIQKRVRSFSFEPAAINGVAQPASTTLYLTLGMLEAPAATSGYGITSLFTGPRLVKGKYESQPRASGAAYFVVAYNQNGRVTEVRIEQAPSVASDGSFRKWGAALAKSFRFEPEVVNGMSVPGSARVPISFCAYGDTACPRLERLASPKGSNLGGDMIADSVLKLNSPLTGG